MCNGRRLLLRVLRWTCSTAGECSESYGQTVQRAFRAAVSRSTQSGLNRSGSSGPQLHELEIKKERRPSGQSGTSEAGTDRIAEKEPELNGGIKCGPGFPSEETYPARS